MHVSQFSSNIAELVAHVQPIDLYTLNNATCLYTKNLKCHDKSVLASLRRSVAATPTSKCLYSVYSVLGAGGGGLEAAFLFLLCGIDLSERQLLVFGHTQHKTARGHRSKQAPLKV